MERFIVFFDAVNPVDMEDILPSQFETRKEYRAALIDRKNKLREQNPEIDQAIAHFKSLGLEIIDQPLLNCCIVSGKQETLELAMKQTGVRVEKEAEMTIL